MRLFFATLTALIMLSGAAVAQQGAGASSSGQLQGRPAEIDGVSVVVLIRSTLLALDHANKTGNYTVFRELGAPGFENANSTARLAEIFAAHRSRQLDLSTVAVLDPKLYSVPLILQNGMLHMTGFVPSGQAQVDFEFLFAAVDERWELFGLSVDVSETPALPAPTPGPEASPGGESPAPSGSDSPPLPQPRP